MIVDQVLAHALSTVRSLDALSAVSITSAFVLLLWRFWSFTLRPHVHPESPQTLPYWIPWFGHTIKFLSNGGRLITQGRLHFKNSRKPFALVLGGQYVYIITSARDTTAVFKKAEELSFDSYLKDMLTRFGMSPATMNAIWQSQKGASVHPGAAVAHAQLLPGPRMAEFQTSLLGHIHKRVTWTGIPDLAVHEKKASTKVVSLQHWVRHALTETLTRALFGNLLLEIEPDITETLAQYDHDSWKFTYQVPSFLSREMLKAKSRTQDAIYRYFELPLSDRDDACWMIKAMEAEMKELGATPKDMSSSIMLFYWVANTNAWKAAFWMIARILFDQKLRKKVEDEIADSFQNQENLSPDELQEFLDKSILLKAIYFETLRTTATSISVRDVLEDCIVGETRLQKGSRLIIPFQQMLLDEQVFGADVEAFNAMRFIDNPSLEKDPSFRPFGGGVTFCPGRFLAQKETLTLVALLFHRFHIQLHENDQEFPAYDTSTPSLGIMAPASGQDVLVDVKERVQ